MMKTTDLLTFFQPGEAAGTTWTFSSPAGSEWREVWAYVAEEVDLSRFTARELLPEHFRQLLAELGVAVRKHGGILVEAAAHNDVIRLTVSGGEVSGYRFPGKLLRLKAYGDPCLETITDTIDLKAGDHLIVPVSAAAERKLASFREALRGLPADLESSVLNVLRRPSLEWRIHRIERILSLPPATHAEVQRSRAQRETPWQKLRRFFLWPVPAGFVAAGLLLLVGALTGYNRVFGSAPQANGTGEVVSDTGAAGAAPATGVTEPVEGPAEGNRPSADSGPEPEMEKALGELFAVLKSSENSAIQMLYTSHFGGHAGDAFGASSPVVWGIAKLEALKLGLVEETDAELLGNSNTRTALRKVFDDPPKGELLAKDKNALALLAWSSCQRYKRPALMVNAKDRFPYAFAIDRNCNQIKSEDALAGLEDLTNWVKNRKK